ncbi:hypothetical protein AOLI_G00186930 [Acnodon oligacanthus]
MQWDTPCGKRQRDPPHRQDCTVRCLALIRDRGADGRGVCGSSGPGLGSGRVRGEEWVFHSQQRYGGSVKQMLRACFSSSTLAGLCVVFLALVVGGVTYTPKQWTLVVLTGTLYLLLKTLGVLVMTVPAPVEISEVCESRKMNVAHGLAWSFYVGYLKLVLPELEKQVRKHYSETGEVLSSIRLHILLPLSAAATTKLEEVDRNVLFHKNLPELQLDRAGVRGRVYKHSIYKITHQNKETSRVAEPHYLSQELIKTLQQQEQEIPMDLTRELPRPVAEEGTRRVPVWGPAQRPSGGTAQLPAQPS